MNASKKVLLIACLSLFFLADNVVAQQYSGTRTRSRHVKGFKKVKHYELLTIYGGLGFSTYYGDLCEGLDCMKLRPQFGIGALYRLPYFHERMHVKSELNYFRLYAEDYHPRRNLSFRSNNVELYTSAMISLFPYEKHRSRRTKFDPYLFVGVGLVYYAPQAKLNGSWYGLRKLETEGKKYSPIAPMIPYGIGTRVNVGINWNAMFEAGYRWTFTDYLDDVSGAGYKDVNSFSDPVAKQLSYRSAESGLRTRGNPNKNDGYFIFTARLTYTFSEANFAKFRGKQHILRK
jgi:hypothetical protein